MQPATEAELKALGDDIPEGTVAGWASSADLDSYRDIVVPGAFDASIAKRGLTGPKGVKLLLNHDWSKVAGAIKTLETRNGKLWIEAQLNLNISYAKDAYEAVKSAGGLSFSVGFILQDYNIRQDANGRDYFELVKGDLFEVSVVPFPANEEATMEFFKSAEIVLTDMSADLETDEEETPATLADFEKMLVSTGLAKSRNDARLITLEVKNCPHLFTAKGKELVSEPAPVQTQEPKTEGPTEAPVAEKSLNSIFEATSRLKALFAPTTQEG